MSKKHKFKVAYDVKNIEKGNGIYCLITEKYCYFDSLQEAFKFTKEIYGSRHNGVEVVGRPSIERM